MTFMVSEKGSFQCGLLSSIQAVLADYKGAPKGVLACAYAHTAYTHMHSSLNAARHLGRVDQ